ncbi:hypothetical protein F4809DRAFT_599437 [Biscogniauxia mediterranea]|nr:hypothetical protein F4809DRAFT_599437 [Biscogniauxia mediterranea]
MLLRQLLQQPLSRSVATAATWRPATSALLLPLHRKITITTPAAATTSNSSSSSNRRSYSSSPPPDKDGGDEEKNTPSLFEQLFPEEAKEQQKQSRSAIDGGKTSTWLSQLFQEPPPAPTLQDLESNSQDNNTISAEHEDSEGHMNAALRAKSMLILTAASKYLLESDFLRLGRKGKHVEGWVAGIIKVIQARDPDTLEPLGHYFILFDHPSAARAYKEEVERLWRLGKQHVPGAHHRKDSEKRQPLTPGAGIMTERGEDVASLIRSFTLIPPSQRYRLALGRDGDLRAAERLDQGGSFVDQLARRAGSRFLVLLSVDGGRISVDTLRRAIEDDGAERHLPWRVRGHEDGDGAIADGVILPFGRSVVKARDQDYEENLREQGERAGGIGSDEEGAEGKGEGQGEDSSSPATAADEGGGSSSSSSSTSSSSSSDDIVHREHDRKYRRYPRFIVPFEDAAEAHRFVRSWHRREVLLRMDHDNGMGRISGIIGGLTVTWEESRIINAAVMW